MRKIVRFYDLRLLPNGSADSQRIGPGFWRELGERIDAKPPTECQETVRGRVVHGEHRRCRTPAVPYLYVGRVRDRSDWPDTLDSGTGVVGELERHLRDLVLIERTYVVPFGAQNRVAVLTMSQSSPRVSVLEEWLTRLAGMNPTEQLLTLIPILDSHVAERLEEASGATIFKVHVEPHAEIPDGGGEIGQATRVAKAVSADTDVILKWSLANRAGTAQTNNDLLRAARWARSDWAKSAVVSLQFAGDDEDGPRVEQYDLITHHFTRRQHFDVPPGAYPSEESVVGGITDAIGSFNRAFS